MLFITLPCYCEVVTEDFMEGLHSETDYDSPSHAWSRIAVNAVRIVKIQELVKEDWFYGQGCRSLVMMSSEGLSEMFYTSVELDDLVRIIEKANKGLIFKQN